MNESHIDELFDEEIKYEKSWVPRLNKNSRQWLHRRPPTADTSSAMMKHMSLNHIIAELLGGGVDCNVSAVSTRGCVAKIDGPEHQDSK